MSDINKLKNEVIEAFIAHELGMELKYTNSQYDKMLAEVKEAYPDFNPFEYLPLPEGSLECEHRSGLVWLEKWEPEGNDIRQYWFKEKGKIKLPKYDGSSGVIYYTNGKLSHIASMSDKEVGIIQTDKFKEFVPQEVPENISYLRFEELVDVRKYENARGKANGLMNSKYLQDEVDELCTLVVFQGVDINANIIPWEELESYNLPILLRPDGRPYFMLSPRVEDIELCSRIENGIDVERGIAHYYKLGVHDSTIDFKFCIDGIVYTEDDSYGPNWCYKYDYLTSKEAYVEDISWRETDREGYTSVLVIDPIQIDGKWMYGPSTNGVPKLIEFGCGPGSRVEVAFSKTTIPKVVGVIETAPITYPICPCGNQLSEDDLMGALIRCQKPECSHKLELREQWMEDNLANKGEYASLTDKEYILMWLEWFVFTFLNIARFNYENNRWYDFDTFSVDLLNSIKNEDDKRFIEIIESNYHMSALMKQDLKINALSTIKTINKRLK